MFIPASRAEHFTRLRGQLDEVSEKFNEAEELAKEEQSREFGSDFGLTINIESLAGYPLKYESLSLIHI